MIRGVFFYFEKQTFLISSFLHTNHHGSFKIGDGVSLLIINVCIGINNRNLWKDRHGDEIPIGRGFPLMSHKHREYHENIRSNRLSPPPNSNALLS